MKSKPMWIVAACFCLILHTAQGQDASDAKTDQKDQAKATTDRAALEKKLSERMTNAVLTGSFTITGRKQEGKLRTEKYTITSAKKLRGDLWIFQARIQYGGRDVTLPVPLYVKWAGDTPVLTLTNMAIPGLGTFTVRVLIYENHYGGMWRHDKVVGNMFGTITRGKDKAKAKPDAQPKEKADKTVPEKKDQAGSDKDK